MQRRIFLSTVAAALLVGSTVALADSPVTMRRIDGDYSHGAGGGKEKQCRYSASVHGTITPVDDSNRKAKSAPVVNPKIDVTATLECPNLEVVRVTDNVMATGPLTNDELAHALERRGTLVATGASGRCVYVPEFTLSGNDLKLRSVNSDCH